MKLADISDKNMSLQDLGNSMLVRPHPYQGIDRWIWASVCIVAYHSGVSPNYVVSRDWYIGLLGLTDELECLRCS